MRRRTRPRPAAGWAFAVFLSLLAPRAAAADWLAQWPWAWSTPRDPKMAEIVAALRAEEARYRDIEYVVRIMGRDPQRKDPAAPSEVTTMARRRVVVQGDRTYFRHEAFERIGAIRYRHEETSACDGERTRTVVAGNCANIHLGRWRHPRLLPAHSLPLTHNAMNFPLSIYLAGTDAIHAYLGIPPALAETNPWQSFRKIEARLDGEDTIDGLHCLRIRVDLQYQPNQPPLKQYLWLAPARNYLCIKEDKDFNGYRYVMRVPELREAAPGVWFPARVSLVIHGANNPNGANPALSIRSDLTIDEVGLSPRHAPAFFRDVAIPAGLPVFTIKDRRLVDSILPEPFDDDWGKDRLAGLARRVADQEQRYDAIEVKSRTLTTYPRTFISNQGIRFDEMTEERSVLRGARAWSSSRRSLARAEGRDEIVEATSGYDGEWSRSWWRQGSPANVRGVRATLRRGREVAGVSLHRPHTLMRSGDWGGEKLSDLLSPTTRNPGFQPSLRFRYCGAAEVDGHPCIEVRGDSSNRGFHQNQTLVLYLATDRNAIPIRAERHVGWNGQRPVLLSVTRCGDLREIAPGLWYPYRISEFNLDISALPSYGRIVLNTRRETTIDSVASASRVDEDVFRNVRVPAGIAVQVLDESGQAVGQVQWAEEGIPRLSLKRYLELRSNAVAPPNQQFGVPVKQRADRKLPDRPIGQPMPDFPRGAAWLGGKPATRESLRGRVVVLAFWSEWKESCREDLTLLNRFGRDARDGLAIVGIHPPGSEPAEITAVIDALKLDYPTCVDRPAAEGTNAWGELFGALDVGSVPQAIAFDGEGKGIASGRLEDVLEKVRPLVRKAR